MLPFSLKERERLNKKNGGDENNKDKSKVSKRSSEKSLAPIIPIDVFNKIEELTLEGLGKPPCFYKTEIKFVAPKSYRVNIVCITMSERDMIPNITRPHSYFVNLSPERGYIFNPELKREY